MDFFRRLFAQTIKGSTLWKLTLYRSRVSNRGFCIDGRRPNSKHYASVFYEMDSTTGYTWMIMTQ